VLLYVYVYKKNGMIIWGESLFFFWRPSDDVREKTKQTKKEGIFGVDLESFFVVGWFVRSCVCDDIEPKGSYGVLIFPSELEQVAVAESLSSSSSLSSIPAVRLMPNNRTPFIKDILGTKQAPHRTILQAATVGA